MQTDCSYRDSVEDMIYQSFDRISTITLVPVRSISNHNADFNLACILVKVEIHAVSDLFAFECFNGKTTTVGRRRQFLDVACQEV